MAYDVVRLDNYLKENKPNESIFDLLPVGMVFSENLPGYEGTIIASCSQWGRLY